MQEIWWRDREPEVVCSAPQFNRSKIERHDLLPEARAPIAANFYARVGKSFEHVQHQVVVAAEPEDVPGEEQCWSCAGRLDGRGIACIWKFVEQLAGECADSTAQEQSASTGRGGPECIVGGEQPEFQLHRPHRKSNISDE